MEIVDNQTSRHFEVVIGKEKAYIEYEKQPNKVYLTKVMVPDLENADEIKQKLIRSVLDYIENDGQKVIPYTKSIKNFIKENPEYKRMLLNGIRL
ncbi:hypothetical protein UJ101_00079 [Flavobacteriaceae bacterium UJ101]|nr:hypothetical protein UJ101_00079 [Flavobacteriaceae bacterium UJ101]